MFDRTEYIQKTNLNWSYKANESVESHDHRGLESTLPREEHR